MLFSVYRCTHASCDTIKHTYTHHRHGELAREHSSYTLRYVVKDRSQEESKKDQNKQQKPNDKKRTKEATKIPKKVIQELFSAPNHTSGEVYISTHT